MAAISAPNRFLEVRAICDAHPEVFRGPVDQSDERRRAFLPSLIFNLNQVDAGEWGALLKTDQGNKIPADVIVWRPTLEHFDVMTDTGAIWDPKGVIANPAWRWVAVGSPRPADPPPPAPRPLDLADVLGLLDAIRDDVLEQAATLQEIVDTLRDRTAPAPPTYRGSVFGVPIVLRPDPPAGPKA